MFCIFFFFINCDSFPSFTGSEFFLWGKIFLREGKKKKKENNSKNFRFFNLAKTLEKYVPVWARKDPKTALIFRLFYCFFFLFYSFCFSSEGDWFFSDSKEGFLNMADALSVIPAAVLRNLSDKLYEKRKNAALEVCFSSHFDSISIFFFFIGFWVVFNWS